MTDEARCPLCHVALVGVRCPRCGDRRIGPEDFAATRQALADARDRLAAERTVRAADARAGAADRP